MLDVASPVATSSSDVSNPSDNVETASSSSPPSSDAISNPAMADTPSNPSEQLSLDAAPLKQSNPSGTTSSRASTNFDAMAQYGALVGSDPRLTQTPNSASVFDIIQSGNPAPSVPNVVNTLGSNVQNNAASNIPLSSGLNPALPTGLSSGNGDLAPSISPATVANISGLYSNIPQNGAVNVPQASGSNPIGSILPPGISSENLNLHQNGAVNDISLVSGLDSIKSASPTGILSGNGVAPSQSGTMVNTLGSNSNITQNGAVNEISLASGLNSIGSIPPGILSGNGVAPSQTSTIVNTLGSNSNIPPNGAVPPASVLDPTGFIPPTDNLSGNLAPVSSQANTGMNTLGSNLNILQKGAVDNNPLASDLDSFRSMGNNIAGINTLPVSSLTGSLRPVQATSLESIPVSDPLRQSSSDSLNSPASNGVETSPSQTVTSPERTTNGNCICNSYESAYKGYQ